MSLVPQKGHGINEAGGGGLPLKWNTVTSSDKYTFSVDDTVATQDGGSRNTAFGLYPKTTGKWYCEIEITIESSKSYVGVAIEGYGSSSELNQSGSSSYRTGGNKYCDGNQGSHDGNDTGDGQINMVAIDFDAQLFWIGVDGIWVNSGDPASAANPACSGSSFNSSTMAVNGQQTGDVFTILQSPTYAIPAGFSYWEG